MNPRMMLASFAAFSCMTVASCEKRAEESTGTESRPAAEAPKPPDNTANNAGDGSSTATTPMGQSESPSDIKISAEIRRAILEDKSMSVNAQNCKIITANGVVTLRGVVDSQSEKDAIGEWAKNVAGVASVDNQLEVRTP